ncbi:hypothetical protein B0H16DRAFT_1695897 [Mycena metata]|uniref:Uncharacterized protein n=1 Tax=Mycena metata TaxID=1033252 RepID=A0AAD7MWW0_9AGAR|nr:hypothetical protein B0H16DRAFT_1695897 [Mycena metata]
MRRSCRIALSFHLRPLPVPPDNDADGKDDEEGPDNNPNDCAGAGPIAQRVIQRIHTLAAEFTSFTTGFETGSRDRGQGHGGADDVFRVIEDSQFKAVRCYQFLGIERAALKLNSECGALRTKELSKRSFYGGKSFTFHWAAELASRFEIIELRQSQLNGSQAVLDDRIASDTSRPSEHRWDGYTDVDYKDSDQRMSGVVMYFELAHPPDVKHGDQQLLTWFTKNFSKNKEMSSKLAVHMGTKVTWKSGVSWALSPSDSNETRETVGRLFTSF